MSYKSYKNYTNHKSYNNGVRVASFITGLARGFTNAKEGEEEKEKISRLDRPNRNK